MNDSERKVWEELVECTRMEDAPEWFMGAMKSDDYGWNNVYDDAILAADLELARLRARVGEYNAMEDWLRKNHGYFDYMEKDDSFQFTRERERERHFTHGKTLLEAFRLAIVEVEK